MRGIGTWPYRLAPSVAGGFHLHQPRVLAVLHVADELAVLDQHGLVGRRAFVVDRERAAPRRDGAVIDHGDALGRDLLAHQAREGRGLLAIEIAFEAVADRFVQHHAGPAGAEHDIHLAGGRRNGFQIDQSLPHGVIGRVAPGARLDEALIAFAAAVTVAAGFLARAIAGDDRHIEPHQRTHVAIDFAVGAQNFHDLP